MVNLHDVITEEYSKLRELYNYLSNKNNMWYKFSLPNISKRLGIKLVILKELPDKYNDIIVYSHGGVSFMSLRYLYIMRDNIQ